MPVAITRKLSAAITNCELTHRQREPIDVELAGRQHDEYERCLEELGCRVVSLPAEPDLPDAVFVEDTAVVVEEVAVITRPGAKSRRAETASIAKTLAAYRSLAAITEPGILDGGDVLRLGKRFLVGRTERSNQEGIRQLAALLGPFGYSVEGIDVRGCLHLKSGVTQVAADALLLNPEFVAPGKFPGFRLIEVDPTEPGAANALLLDDAVLFPCSYPKTAERLAAAGLRLRLVDISELIKAESGVTCSSLILATPKTAR
jgi:dimethylargininase